MTRSMIKGSALLAIALLALASRLCAQPHTTHEDFQTWWWLQVQKKTFRHQYAGLQYQVRFGENSTQFNRSNIYLLYGYSPPKHFNTEVLYQWNTNYRQDQHTVYIGATYKMRLYKGLRCFVRTAAQRTQNYFSGDYQADKPLTEWRNRLRLAYQFNKHVSLTLSAEPYLAFDQKHSPYLSRIRYVSQCNLSYNKYQTFSVFYLYQPDVFTYGSYDRNYALGFVSSIRLPDKWSRFSKLYRPKFLKKSHPEDAPGQGADDTFN